MFENICYIELEMFCSETNSGLPLKKKNKTTRFSNKSIYFDKIWYWYLISFGIYFDKTLVCHVKWHLHGEV